MVCLIRLRFLAGCAVLAATLSACQRTSPDVTRTALADRSAGSPTTKGATADFTTDDAIRTVVAIDDARDIILKDLRHIDAVGYKAVTVKVADGGRVTLSRNMEQGLLDRTGRPLDLAIRGEGYFKIKIHDSINDGVGYTRNGNMFVNQWGEFVLGFGIGNEDPYKFIPPISVPVGTTEFIISQDGNIEVILGTDNTTQNIGAFSLYTFKNPAALTQVAGPVYIESPESGPAEINRPGEGGAGLILQGYLEASNVDVTRECLRLKFLNDWRKTLVESAGLR